MSLPDHDPEPDRASSPSNPSRSSSTRTAPSRVAPRRARWRGRSRRGRPRPAWRGVVFAAAPSQNEFLAGLVADPSIDWSRVVGFHMDEYLGLGPDHPASFRRYLQERLFRLVGLGRSACA